MTTITGSRRLRIGNQDLRVDVRPGDGRGTPLLMCSGVGVGFEAFDRLVDSLDPKTEVIRVDVPGVGGSPPTALPCGFPQLAFMLRKLLDQLGYHEVDVLGYSWGGALAQQFAAQHPSRCRRLVLISASTGAVSVPGSPFALRTMMTPRPIENPEEFASTAGRLFGGNAAAYSEDVRQLFADMQFAGARRGYIHQILALAAWTSLGFLPLIRQKVLVMSGDDDPIVPVANALIIASLLPNATLQVYPGGHAEIITAAPDLGRRITRFLTDDSP